MIADKAAAGNNSRVMRTLAGALVAGLLLSGCVSTVVGTAVRANNARPNPEDVPELTESDLDRIMLSIGELNGIAGTTQMKIASTSEEMTDNSDAVSDLDCLGAIYGAEELVYQDTGWTVVRDEVAREPVDDNDHWVQQIAVLYPSPDDAKRFFESSSAQWKKCAGSSIQISGSATDSEWDIDDATATETMLSQMATQRDADGWGCQHALSFASNLTVETFACSNDAGDEAEAIAGEMIANAAKK